MLGINIKYFFFYFIWVHKCAHSYTTKGCTTNNCYNYSLPLYKILDSHCLLLVAIFFSPQVKGQFYVLILFFLHFFGKVISLQN